MKRLKNIFIGAVLILILVVATAFTWLYSQLDQSLPLISGKQTLLGLEDSVTVERDEQGIATIKGKTRADVALATGFVHAQERFFQMDLLRRNSAGELSSLFGEIALEKDQEIRQHRFRERARKILNQLPQAQQDILQAYTRGVNQGLMFLGAVPFEYLALRQDPVEWREEDTILAVFSMYLDLQYHDGRRERTLALMHDVFSESAFNFLNPKGSEWDAAVDATLLPSFPMPSTPWPAASNAAMQKRIDNEDDYLSEALVGSNNWAVAGDKTPYTSAMVADDMHLGIRVPNTWFRASFEYIEQGKTVKVTGATLPGTPNIVVGSNGSIAWGFTNSYGDWSDIIVLEVNDAQMQYLTPEGYRPFTISKQVLAVSGKPSVEFDVKETIWGPVIGKNHKGQWLAYRWVAHDINAVNLDLIALETASTVDDAFEIGAGAGVPAQNLMVADSQGNIGWSIMGPIPIKKGEIGELPASWSSGENGWTGYLAKADYPRVKNPVHGRLWTGNSRVVGGEKLAKIGNGGYALGARSQQIRDDLFAKAQFSEQDLLDVALDDRAVFLLRWQSFMLEHVFTKENLISHPHWAEAAQIVEQDNALRASVDSVAYRIVRNFRMNLRSNVFGLLNENLSNMDEHFNLHAIRHQLEVPLWHMANTQPENFLWLGEDSWQTMFAKTLDKTLSDMTKEQPLSAATWGQQNTSDIKHPLSSAIPFIGRYLDMPQKQLAGDSYMPRVQGKAFGASQRMIVAPGHEENGIFHMPTSQSGHPWSPYYRIGHSDWEEGKASPFLPGETRYKLTLLSY
ncbi:penicillin acylase family protein [Thalassotalea agarivorans]|uniref:Penicillin amidase n=1 Tax=Thalassotalea agarivorans TaxID=349064 RepID=A0A1H9ZG62_THASX|nr:penicillin acylase family protein [Thalassotalea agarivorans]SES80526.1 penicillin amidase [Thalassotalea agarivorans]